MALTNPDTGLTREQAAQRERIGQINRDRRGKTNSVATIIRRNVFTFFNLINAVMAILILLNGVNFESLRNVLFLGVALCNTGIGLVQEIRAKRATDRLRIISESTVTAVRDSSEIPVPTGRVVLGDILILTAGSQVPADCEIVRGECVADESVLTGEADGILRREGERLLSGSFIISGTVRARTTAVGADSYGNRLVREAKHIKRKKSDIVHTINVILAVMSVVILPLGAGLFMSQYSGGEYTDALFATSAAVIGMLPEGMVLLTSTVFAVANIMLARHRVLSQDLYSAETLARTDVLCLDKTGTLTEGRMEVTQVVPLTDDDIDALMCDFTAVSTDRNATITALREKFTPSRDKPDAVFCPFDSRRKWSAADFGGTALVLGAPDFILPQEDSPLLKKISEYSAHSRVVLLARCTHISPAPSGVEPLALILLRDRVRPQAGKTMRYFESEGVTVKIISGDSTATVSAIAERCSVDGWNSAIDMSTASLEDIDSIAEEYTVFGRVTPEIKRELVCALKRGGHTVAMTGDGVNDVLALREADCSIAPASGTDIARDASKLVLLDNDFDALPEVVRQGRRSINNLKRSVSLFLIKIVYSVLMSVAFLFLTQSYPFEPIHLTLITFVGVGLPGLLLSFEPNSGRVSGRFITDIIVRSLPGGIAIAAGVIITALISAPLELTHPEYETVCVISSGIIALLNLFRTCAPFSRFRFAVFIAMCALFTVAIVAFGWVFSLAPLSLKAALTLTGITLFSAAIYAAVLGIAHAAVRKGQKK